MGGVDEAVRVMSPNILRSGAVMKMLVAMAAATLLAGCGVDAVGTAATAAAMKKQEVQEGQRTMQQAQEKINAAMQQEQERAAAAAAD